MPELTWVGKDKVITHHLDVPYHVLERQYSFDEQGQHADDNGSPNMIIHGDNLEALKSLLPQYEGKVDCIYIDPPYNTGNENWIYNDNVNDPRIRKWLGEVVGREGDDLSRHDKWLCMMYPRLRLLRSLLAPTGVIFVSIDDHEQASLKFLCDEIFGRANHLATFVWESTGHMDNQADITGVHEYIHAYAKDARLTVINALIDPNVPEDSKIRRNFVENSCVKNGAKNPPSFITIPSGFPSTEESLYLPAHEFASDFLAEVEPIGYITREVSKKYPVSYPLRLDPLIVENGKTVSPCRVFSGWMNANKLQRFIENDSAPVPEGDGSFHFYVTKSGTIYYRKEGRQSHYVQTVLRNLGTTETNKYMLEAMGLSFDFPKPIELIDYLINMHTPKDGLVLDSFAGSGTTAHAVLQGNTLTGANRSFILIELGDYAEDLTAHRVRSAITGFERSGKAVPAHAGSFSYYVLGPCLMTDGLLNPEVSIDDIRDYIWFSETKSPTRPHEDVAQYFLGIYAGTGYHLMYEPDRATTLSFSYLSDLPSVQRATNSVIYADVCTVPVQTLRQYNVTFKKIPRDITKL